MLLIVVRGNSEGWHLDVVPYFIGPVNDIGIGYDPDQSYQPVIYLTQGWQFLSPLKSTDEGVTWTEMPHGYSGIVDDRCVVVHPTNPLIMYKGVPGNASEGRGIIRSEDGGYNWTPVFSICTIDPTRMAIFPEYPERVIFGNG